METKKLWQMPRKTINLTINGVKITINGADRAAKWLRSIGFKFVNNKLYTKSGRVDCSCYDNHGKKQKVHLYVDYPDYEPNDTQKKERIKELENLIITSSTLIEATKADISGYKKELDTLLGRKVENVLFQ